MDMLEAEVTQLLLAILYTQPLLLIQPMTQKLIQAEKEEQEAHHSMEDFITVHITQNRTL
jgi:hypothetical protein